MPYFQSEKIAKARKKLSITAEKLVEETLEETNKTEKHVEKMRNIIDDLDEDIDSPFFKMPLPPPPKPKVWKGPISLNEKVWLKFILIWVAVWFDIVKENFNVKPRKMCNNW